MTDTTAPTISSSMALDQQKTAFFVVVAATDDLTQPAPILGWPTLTYTGNTPPVYEPPEGYIALPLPEMTAERWHMILYVENGTGNSKAYLNGKIVDYTTPPCLPSLKDQARAALQTVQQHASMTAAMGETFGPKMRDYVKALCAIIDGSDTTLPTAPDDPTT